MPGSLFLFLLYLPQRGMEGKWGWKSLFFITFCKRLHFGLLYIGLLLVSFVQSQFKCNNDAYRKSNLSTILE